MTEPTTNQTQTPPLETAGTTSTPRVATADVSPVMLELLHRELTAAIKAVGRARGMEVRIVVAGKPHAGNAPIDT